MARYIHQLPFFRSIMTPIITMTPTNIASFVIYLNVDSRNALKIMSSVKKLFIYGTIYLVFFKYVKYLASESQINIQF